MRYGGVRYWFGMTLRAECGSIVAARAFRSARLHLNRTSPNARSGMSWPSRRAFLNKCPASPRGCESRTRCDSFSLSTLWSTESCFAPHCPSAPMLPSTARQSPTLETWRSMPSTWTAHAHEPERAIWRWSSSYAPATGAASAEMSASRRKNAALRLSIMVCGASSSPLNDSVSTTNLASDTYYAIQDRYSYFQDCFINWHIGRRCMSARMTWLLFVTSDASKIVTHVIL